MKQENVVDFSPLAELNKHKSHDILYAFVWIVAVMAVIILGALWSSVAVQLIGYFGIFVGLGLFIYSSIQTNKHRRAILAQFAAVNSWQYSEGSRDVSKVGTVFSLGHSRNMQNIYMGTSHGLPFRLYTYSYVVGYGKNQQIYDLQVFELALPRSLPHMVIDSLVEGGNGGRSTLPIEFAESQKIELEGDFSKYFSLYAPDNYGITALTVLAPDVMETLMKFAASCDIEIIQDRLYFFWPDIPGSQKSYQDIFTTVNQVLDQTLRKLTTSDIFASKNQAMVQSKASMSGSKLVKSWWNSTTKLGLMITGMIIAYSSSALVGGDAGITINFISFIMIAIGGLTYVISYIGQGIARAKKRSDLKDRKFS
jgi:hypothetical protein